MNPTPKGYRPTDEFSQRQMEQDLSRISGPLIDRIDIHVEVPPVPYRQLSGQADGTDSATMRQQIVAARRIQTQRNGSAMLPNCVLSGRQFDRLVPLDDPGQQLLKQAMTELGLSARAYDKVHRIARTIADLEASADIQVQHVAEAVQYRLLDGQQV